MAGCRMGRWPPTWKSEIRKLCEVRGRQFRVALPADRDSWVAGTRPAAQSATGPHSGQNAGGADERRNCDERIIVSPQEWQDTWQKMQSPASGFQASRHGLRRRFTRTDR